VVGSVAGFDVAHEFDEEYSVYHGVYGTTTTGGACTLSRCPPPRTIAWSAPGDRSSSSSTAGRRGSTTCSRCSECRTRRRNPFNADAPRCAPGEGTRERNRPAVASCPSPSPSFTSAARAGEG
jgi:hypothetical protein